VRTQLETGFVKFFRLFSTAVPFLNAQQPHNIREM